MITRLKQRKNAKTPKAQLSIRDRFKKPLIRIIDSAPFINSHKTNTTINNDDDDDISFNTSKITTISEKFKSKKGDMKKSIMSNASLVKELLIKAVDKHKVELCTQMASQLVEVYNNKQVEKLNTAEKNVSVEKNASVESKKEEKE